MYCITCRYDLRATPSGPCPECGRVFDANDSASYFDGRPRRRPPLWAVAWLVVSYGGGFLASLSAALESSSFMGGVMFSLISTAILGSMFALVILVIAVVISIPIELFGPGYGWFRFHLRRRH